MRCPPGSPESGYRPLRTYWWLLVSEIHAYGRWPSNAELIRDVATLYLPLYADVLDATYGAGVWTRGLLAGDKFPPPRVIANDLNPDIPCLFHHDFRHFTPRWDWTFDVTMFDPPYKLNGTPSGDDDIRYGVDQPSSIEERMDLILDGVTGCLATVKAKGQLWVKCADQVASGQVVWQTEEVISHARAKGCDLVDRFDRIRTPRPQPPGRRQVHARRNGSTLLVFRKKGL